MLGLISIILLTLLPPPCTPEDCFNGQDDDGDGLADLNDPDCICHPSAEVSGPELIFNGGFEQLSNTPECQGCVSLFDSDGCPEGWLQESVNLHMPCFTSANPSQNIGYIRATDNYQGVGGFGIDANNERQQEEFLQTALTTPLLTGNTYLFTGDFEIPSTTIPGINLAVVHRLVILGSSVSTAPIDLVGSGCYEERSGWEVLGFIDVINRPQDNFSNYRMSFVAPGPIEQLVVTSACCQPELPTDERLTYYGVDNLSLRMAEPLPLVNELQISSNDCTAAFTICAQEENGANYQWYREGIALAAATGPCLTLPSGLADGASLQVWITTNDNCIILDTVLNRGCLTIPEICGNGLDDDADGLIDFNDPDCLCGTTTRPLALSEAYCPTDISLSVIRRGNELVQWIYQGIPLDGARESTLTLTEDADLLGQYFAVITDPVTGACQLSEVFQPRLPDALSFTSVIEAPSCFNGSDAAITTSFSLADTSNYLFSWRTEAGEVISDLPDLNAITAGRYQLELIAPGGCSGIYNFAIPSNPAPSISIRIAYDSCGRANPGGTLNLSSPNLNPPLLHHYSITSGSDITQSSQNNIFLLDGNYQGFTTDANGCRVDWEPIIVKSPTLGNLQVFASDLVIPLGSTVDLSATTNANFQGWEPAEIFVCPTCPNTSATPTTSVWVTAIAGDPVNGCVLSDSLFLVVDNSERLFIPNAFSPNFDGVNDRWTIFDNESLSNVGILNIYDRWGAIVHTGEGNLGWDGRNGAEHEVAAGVYIFTLPVSFIDGSSRVLSGEILLVK